MDFQHTLETLAGVPDHDLFRLGVVVQRLLADPRRTMRIRALLHLGQAVSFVDPTTGTDATGRVHGLGSRTVTIVPDADRTRRWELPYPAVITDPTARAEAPPRAPVVPPSAFRLGDTVGFTDRFGVAQTGRVVRCNLKSVTVDCDGTSWRVPPSMLRRVVDI